MTAISPLEVMALDWPVLGERATGRRVAGGVIGVAGVALLVLRSPDGATLLGLDGAGGAVLSSAVGIVLVKRWEPPVDLLTLTSWQLVSGGLLLVPPFLLVEGAPPALEADAVGRYLWLALVGTALAYVLWFRGLRTMPAGSVALIGLVNPVVGTALGVVVIGETFGPAQALGTTLVLAGVVAGQVNRSQRALAHRPGPPDPAYREDLEARRQVCTA